jgi:enoyl-CoA hydratase/carnithine racemase
VACDLLVASSDAVLSIPAVREGLVAALGPMRITRLIGAGPAKYLCLLGRRFSADEGLSMGLISEVVAPGDLEQRALDLAEELLAIPFTALRHTKRQINRSFEQNSTTLMEEMVAAQVDCLRSPEHLAVMKAYLESQAQRKKHEEGGP